MPRHGDYQLRQVTGLKYARTREQLVESVHHKNISLRIVHWPHLPLGTCKAYMNRPCLPPWFYTFFYGASLSIARIPAFNNISANIRLIHFWSYDPIRLFIRHLLYCSTDAIFILKNTWSNVFSGVYTTPHPGNSGSFDLPAVTVFNTTKRSPLLVWSHIFTHGQWDNNMLIVVPAGASIIPTIYLPCLHIANKQFTNDCNFGSKYAPCLHQGRG